MSRDRKVLLDAGAKPLPRPVVYLDHSTLVDAFDGKRGAGPNAAANAELAEIVDAVARRGTLCLSVIHLFELAPSDYAVEMATWLGALPHLWFQMVRLGLEPFGVRLLSASRRRRSLRRFGVLLLLAKLAVPWGLSKASMDSRARMRATTLIRTILALKRTRVTAVRYGPVGVEAEVAPTTRVPICSGCGCRCRRRYDRRRREWRHLDCAGMATMLVYEQQRVDCRRCGVRAEMVPWAETGSRFTRDFEDQVAYLAQVTDKTTVSTTMRIAWRTVGQIIGRVVARLAPEDRDDGSGRSAGRSSASKAERRQPSSFWNGRVFRLRTFNFEKCCTSRANTASRLRASPSFRSSL